MYEAQRGEFRYTIERRLAKEGGHTWHWQVACGSEPVGSGTSPRSHTHAETAALALIFQLERREHARAANQRRTFPWSIFCPQ